MAAARILVVGCGAIGGVLAGSLLSRGHDVTVMTTNALVAEALRSAGLRVRGAGRRVEVPVPVVLEALAPADGPFDYALLATQPPQVEAAARSALEVLAPGGQLVCLQNGLCEERVAAFAGTERVLGAVVAWGASSVDAGVYDRTSLGGFALGALDGRIEASIEGLARILADVGPVTLTQNLRGARWSKLALNCAVSTLGTIGGDRLGNLLRQGFVRRLGLEIVTEVVTVARAEGVTLEKVAGTVDLQWLTLQPEEKSLDASAALIAKHGLVVAFGARFRRLRSSMLGAIERGRAPAVDFLNGEVVRRAEAHGIGVPVNRNALELVWAIAHREARAGAVTLRTLYERTREAG